MNKQDFSRIAADRSQLEKFKNETIDKINAGIVDYIVLKLPYDTTFSELYELLSFNPTQEYETKKYNVDISFIGPGCKAKGELKIEHYPWANTITLDSNFDGTSSSSYSWSGYSPTDKVVTLFIDHSVSTNILIQRPSGSDVGSVLTCTTESGNIAWRAPAAGGTKLYKHELTIDNKTMTIITNDSSAMTSITKEYPLQNFMYDDTTGRFFTHLGAGGSGGNAAVLLGIVAGNDGLKTVTISLFGTVTDTVTEL